MRLFLFVIGLPVLAHTLYFLPARFQVRRGEKLVFSLHTGDSFPESESIVAPERLVDARLVHGEQVRRITDFQALGKATHGVVEVAEAGSHWLAVQTMVNSLELNAGKFESYLRDEGLDQVIEWRRINGESSLPGRERYSKYAKSLIVCDTPDEKWRTVAGLEIEFVPEADPSRLRPGDVLPLRLLWRGKAAAGVRVEKAWASGADRGVEVVGRTDSEGRIEARLERAGKWRLHAVEMERGKNPGVADWESYWATLTFEVR
jgi:hypothetical protein